MLKKIIQKYWIFILTFLLFDIYLFALKLNEGPFITYLNIFCYFFLFLIVRETIPLSSLNKNIIYLLYYYYGYLAFVSPIPILFRPVEYWNLIFYTYFEIILKLFIFIISIYLALFSYLKWIKNSYYNFLFALVLGSIVIGLNYHRFLLNPFATAEDQPLIDFLISHYNTMSLSIIVLIIFWIRYYQKYFVLTEYLNLVIFLFTLSNLLETVHFLIYQHNLDVFINGQVFTFMLNMGMIIIWLMRLSYLNKEISIENERYLKNIKYLDGIVSKPWKSSLKNIFISSSTHILAGAIFIIILLVITLYFINIITFYLTINTVFVLISVIMAIYYGLSSVKRDWQNQIGFILQKKKKKN